jgi:hypothetical protein
MSDPNAEALIMLNPKGCRDDVVLLLLRNPNLFIFVLTTAVCRLYIIVILICIVVECKGNYIPQSMNERRTDRSRIIPYDSGISAL